MPALPFIGEIFMGGMNFAPLGFMTCNGQLLPIANYDALFALIGTTYGGDGQSTFALPDLRGRIPINMDQGPGLSNRVIGEMAGSETVTLTIGQMPQHNHLLTATTEAGDASSPSNNFLANTGALDKEYKAPTIASPVTMNAGSIGASGNSQPHENKMPSLVLNFYIAVEGIFPSRN